MNNMFLMSNRSRQKKGRNISILTQTVYFSCIICTIISLIGSIAACLYAISRRDYRTLYMYISACALMLYILLSCTVNFAILQGLELMYSNTLDQSYY